MLRASNPYYNIRSQKQQPLRRRPSYQGSSYYSFSSNFPRIWRTGESVICAHQHRMNQMLARKGDVDLRPVLRSVQTPRPLAVNKVDPRDVVRRPRPPGVEAAVA